MSKEIKPNEFQCAECNEIFEKGRIDEDALIEKDELFPDIAIEDCCIICDDCFKAIFN